MNNEYDDTAGYLSGDNRALWHVWLQQRETNGFNKGSNANTLPMRCYYAHMVGREQQ